MKSCPLRTGRPSRQLSALVRRHWGEGCSLLTLLMLVGMLTGLGIAAGQGPVQASPRQGLDQEEFPSDAEVLDDPSPGTALRERVHKLKEEATAQIQSTLAKVSSPDPKALAAALGVEPSPHKSTAPEVGDDALEDVGDLDGDGVSEFVFEWTPRFGNRSEPRDAGEGLPAWVLFLLAWDGNAWRASPMTEGDRPYAMHVLPKLGSDPAVVITQGLSLVPYPLLFRVQHHAASFVWDSRDEESRYQGYVYGEVGFRHPDGGGSPTMIVSGKADPGVLVFRRASRRGFLATGTYVWDGKAYVPQRIEYSPNQDYTLYRFIAALHLRDFRSAYAVIDPPKFLKTGKPGLELFRKHIENAWPEFLGNHIFEARDSDNAAADDYAFELRVGEKLYVYQPAFSGDGNYLLTALERREE